MTRAKSREEVSADLKAELDRIDSFSSRLELLLIEIIRQLKLLNRNP